MPRGCGDLLLGGFLIPNKMSLHATHRRLTIEKVDSNIYRFNLVAEDGLPYELNQVLNAAEVDLLIRELTIMREYE